MNITNPVPIEFPSTETLKLSSSPYTLFHVKIVISAPTVAQTVTFYNQNGSVEGQPISINSSVEIKLRYVNFSKITFSDSNSYNILATIQTLTFTTQENMALYMSDADFSIVPINNAIITKPLDTNGYVETDDIGLNSKISKLNQDSNGNVGTNIENVIPSNALTNSSLKGTTNSTVSTKLQVTTTSTLAHHFQFINTGSATILIGDTSNQAIPVSGGGVFLWDGSNETTDLSQWYTFSTTASVGFTVIYQ